jgi:hypothetical protein
MPRAVRRIIRPLGGASQAAGDGKLRKVTLWAVKGLVVLARPEGFGRALATYEVPIEGRDEWLAAARRLA